MKIVFIGSGNVATQLALEFSRKGFEISQVYSRTKSSAQQLAHKVKAAHTTSLADLDKDANLYICAVKDDVLPMIAKSLAGIKGVVVHTAGSIDISVFEGIVEKYGVLYPLQTFSKDRNIDLSKIPIFIEANNEDTLTFLNIVASSLSEKVCITDSYQRKILHLSAVFACNFANNMYAMANELLKKTEFGFNVLVPLIIETARKMRTIKPLDAQTGSAVRFDKKVINEHIDLLAENEKYQEIYRLLSENIHELTVK